MPTASRNERKKRRIRRNVTLLTRALQQTQRQATNDRFVLLQVLAANGPAVVPKAITEDTVKNYQTLTYEVLPGEMDPTTMIVILKSTIEEASTPAVTVTKVDEDGPVDEAVA